MTAHNNPISLSDLSSTKKLVSASSATDTVSKRISSNLMYGRKQLVKQLPFYKDKTVKILELGCDMGFMLNAIARQNEKAELIGIDKTASIIKQCEQATKENAQRITLHQNNYDYQDLPIQTTDIAVLSYSLSQAQDWSALIQKVYDVVRPNGYIAVVDFHKANLTSFYQKMARKSVQMDATLLPLLRKHFTEHYQQVFSARLGVWEYFVFIGRKDC